MTRLCCAVASALCGGAASGAHVLVLASGDPTLDDLIVQVLEAGGHTVAIGPDYVTFNGSGLGGVDAVYLQPNFLWNSGDMPLAGQAALRDYIDAGGGLVTAEWTIWKVAGQMSFQTLAETFPALPTQSYTTTTTATFRVATPDPVLTAGVPSEFTFLVTSFAGTETFLEPRPSARVFFDSLGHAANVGGVIGWDFGEGRVINLSTTTGANELTDPNFRRLFSNVFDWVASEGSCYADCTGEGTLDIFDFLCFQDAFSLGLAYADCDGNTVLDVFDFLCFQDAFVVGCP
jgi:hypothetical protein